MRRIPLLPYGPNTHTCVLTFSVWFARQTSFAACQDENQTNTIFAFKVLRYSTSLRWELLAGSEVNRWRSPQAEQGMASRGNQGGPHIVERMNMLGEMQWVLCFMFEWFLKQCCVQLTFILFCLGVSLPRTLLLAPLTSVAAFVSVPSLSVCFSAFFLNLGMHPVCPQGQDSWVLLLRHCIA